MKSTKYGKKRYSIYKKLKKYVISKGYYYNYNLNCQITLKELAKKISKDIRDLKIKVKPTVEGEKLRVTSPSRDALQEVIAFLRNQDYGQPLQFNNYR